MPLDLNNLSARVIEAGVDAFRDQWPVVQGFAEQEFRVLTARLVEIEKQVADGLQPELARLLFTMQKNTAVQVLTGVTELTLLAVEAAINAALAVIREAVNTALGFVLL